MEENVSGCFFSEHSVVTYYFVETIELQLTTIRWWSIVGRKSVFVTQRNQPVTKLM